MRHRDWFDNKVNGQQLGRISRHRDAGKKKGGDDRGHRANKMGNRERVIKP